MPSQVDQCFSQVMIFVSSTYIGCRFIAADRYVLFDVGDNFVQLLLDAFLLDFLVGLKKDTTEILTPRFKPCDRYWFITNKWWWIHLNRWKFNYRDFGCLWLRLVNHEIVIRNSIYIGCRLRSRDRWQNGFVQRNLETIAGRDASLLTFKPHRQF